MNDDTYDLWDDIRQLESNCSRIESNIRGSMEEIMCLLQAVKDNTEDKLNGIDARFDGIEQRLRLIEFSTTRLGPRPENTEDEVIRARTIERLVEHLRKSAGLPQLELADDTI